RVLLGGRANSHKIKIGNARDDAAVALAIDHRPIPNPVHRPLHAEQQSAPRSATLHASEEADNRSRGAAGEATGKPQVQPAASSQRPQPISSSPPMRAVHSPNGNSFSTSTATARTATHRRFI